MAGSEDHYVPIEQFYQQIKMLSQARSVTARLAIYNERECSESLSGRRNYGLALRTIVNWLDGMQVQSCAGRKPNHLMVDGPGRPITILW